jgi:AcrR family transcriptional regulator
MLTIRSQPPKLAFKPRLKGHERRALIEEAAEPLFAERGYAGTSLEDVAAAAGVTRPVIYDHFRSKRELHDALVERHTQELMLFIADRIAAAGPGLEQRMREGISAFFEFVETHPYAWRMLLRDPIAEGSAAPIDRRLQNEVTSGIAALLGGMAAETRVDIGPPAQLTRFAEAMKWASNGLAIWWYENREVPREVLIETMMALCWLGLERLGRSGNQSVTDDAQRS